MNTFEARETFYNIMGSIIKTLFPTVKLLPAFKRDGLLTANPP